MGKAIGLGKVQIDPVGLFLIDRKKRYLTTDIFQEQRYHAALVDESVQGEKWPTDLYTREQLAQQIETLAPHWENLRETFRKTISSNVRNALELLGNPNKVPTVVHTPQVAGINSDKPAMEQENFKWFMNNERKMHQMLTPLDKNSVELPTLSRD